MDFEQILRKRKMCRSFSSEALTHDQITGLVNAATRSPTAGFSQGIEYLILSTPADRLLFWSCQIDDDWLSKNPDHLATQVAPLIMILLADKLAYFDRYSQADKARSGLDKEQSWPVPYWIFDSGASAMLVLLKAIDLDLGALFFGIFRQRELLMETFGIPESLLPIGAIAVGHPAPYDRPRSPATRRRRDPSEQFHLGSYGTPFEVELDRPAE